MKKRIIFSIFLFCGVMKLFTCNFNVFYPKLTFDFNCLFNNAYEKMLPEDNFFSIVDKNTPEVSLSIRHLGGNSSYYSFVPAIFTDKPFKKLYIKSCKYFYQNKTEIIVKNATFILPAADRISEKNWYDTWITNGQLFFTRNCRALDSKTKYKYFKNFKPISIFKKRKPGDMIPFKIIISYNFDNENEKKIELNYEVLVTKGWYVSPFNF